MLNYLEKLKLVAEKGSTRQMGRRKLNRSDKVMQTFESTKPLKTRLKNLADERQITVSALIREILERFFEERNI